MLFLALNIGMNINPDEVTWIGQAQVFSKAFLLPENSPESYQFGLVSNVPYLYPWLMGKALHLNFFSISDLVFLRLVNVCIGMATLWLGWKTVLLFSSNNITRTLFVVMATNTLMLTFLNSFVSYDNLVNFLFDNQMLAQIIYAGYDIGEITCPTRYEEDSSSISLSASTQYGLGVLATSVYFRLHRWGLLKSSLFSRWIRKPNIQPCPCSGLTHTVPDVSEADIQLLKGNHT